MNNEERIQVAKFISQIIVTNLIDKGYVTTGDDDSNVALDISKEDKNEIKKQIEIYTEQNAKIGKLDEKGFETIYDFTKIELNEQLKKTQIKSDHVVEKQAEQDQNKIQQTEKSSHDKSVIETKSQIEQRAQQDLNFDNAISLSQKKLKHPEKPPELTTSNNKFTPLQSAHNKTHESTSTNSSAPSPKENPSFKPPPKKIK